MDASNSDFTCDCHSVTAVDNALAQSIPCFHTTAIQRPSEPSPLTMSADDVASFKARIAFLESQLGERHARPQDQHGRTEQPTREHDDRRVEEGPHFRQEGKLSDQLSLMREDMAKLSEEVKALRLELELQRNPGAARLLSAPLAVQVCIASVTLVN